MLYRMEVPESCTSVAVGCRIPLNLRTRVDNRSSRRTSHLQQLAAKKLHARSALVGSDGRDAALAIGRRVQLRDVHYLRIKR